METLFVDRQAKVYRRVTKVQWTDPFIFVFFSAVIRAGPLQGPILQRFLAPLLRGS